MLFTRLGIVPDKSLRSGYWNINGIRMRKEMKFSFFTIGEEPIIYSLLLLLLLGATVASDVEMWMLMDPTNFLSLSRLPKKKKKKSQQQTDREKRDNSSKQRQRLFSFCVLRRLTFDGRPESLVTISLTRSNSPVLYIYTFPHAKTSFLLLPSNRQEQWYWTSVLFLFFFLVYSLFVVVVCISVYRMTPLRVKRKICAFSYYFFFSRRGRQPVVLGVGQKWKWWTVWKK